MAFLKRTLPSTAAEPIAETESIEQRIDAFESEIAGLPMALTSALEADDEVTYRGLLTREPFLQRKLNAARCELYTTEIRTFESRQNAVEARRAEIVAELHEYRDAEQVYGCARESAEQMLSRIDAVGQGLRDDLRGSRRRLAEVSE
jgi:hypothetical protein